MASIRLSWMVWQEENKAAAPRKTLEEAVAYYTQKYGHAPNRAQTPLGWPPDVRLDGIEIEQRRNILPGCVHLTFDPTLEIEKELVNR